MDRINTTSPAVMYARVFGIVLTLVGILGLLINTDQETTKSLLGFDVNLTHNIVHLATGVLGLIAGFSVIVYARTYALVLGIVYAALGLWGLVAGGDLDPFGLFVNINMADHVLHLAIGVLGLAAWFASRDTTVERV